MKIAINAEKYWNRNTGIGTYTFNLLRQLARVAMQDDLVYFASQIENFTNSRAVFRQLKGFGESNLGRILREQITLPRAVNELRPDVMHYPDHTASLLLKLKCPVSITVHDIAFLRYPEFFNFSRRIYKSFALRRTLKNVSGIIAVSEATKSDLVNYLKVPTEKISVIPNGVDRIFKRLEQRQIDTYRDTHILTDRYILQVGTIEPRKNHLNALKGFLSAREKLGIDLKYIIVGHYGWKSKKAIRFIEELKAKGIVVHLEHVPTEQLVYLYNMADAFLYPSFHEGFGLPIVEAMACGCPVIASNISAGAEVAGNAALLVDPHDTESIADAIARLCRTRELAFRLRNDGLRRSRDFSWENTAAKTLDYFHKRFDSSFVRIP